MRMTPKEYVEWCLSKPRGYEEIRLVPAASHVLGDVSIMGKVYGEWVQLFLNFEDTTDAN